MMSDGHSCARADHFLVVQVLRTSLAQIIQTAPRCNAVHGTLADAEVETVSLVCYWLSPQVVWQCSWWWFKSLLSTVNTDLH